MIQLDGAEGGGQILRSALSLSMITGKAFSMHHIRGQRSKPGLMRQHLTCVKAAASIASASTDGAEMHSKEIIFKPSSLNGGEYEFRIGSAGSTMLLLQTLLPALLFAKQESSLILQGGTHNPMAPSADFLKNSFIPILCSMGAEVDFSCQKMGFVPAGGGVVEVKVKPLSGKLKQRRILERGEYRARRVEVLCANLRPLVARDELKLLKQHLRWQEIEFFTREVTDSDGSGNVISLELEYPDHVMHLTAHGEMNKGAARVVGDLVKVLQSYIKSDAAVNAKLADQLLLPMALAGGGAIKTLGVSNHIRTNIDTIEAFLPVKFSILEQPRSVIVSCEEV
jgi:RNA 3'-terminal phosphate cyclase (ATP)